MSACNTGLPSLPISEAQALSSQLGGLTFFLRLAELERGPSITGTLTPTRNSARWISTPGSPQLSYWVDYWLAADVSGIFRARFAQLLQSTNSDNAEIEVLPIVNTDGSVVVMVSNHAVASATDNNGEV